MTHYPPTNALAFLRFAGICTYARLSCGYGDMPVVLGYIQDSRTALADALHPIASAGVIAGVADLIYEFCRGGFSFGETTPTAGMPEHESYLHAATPNSFQHWWSSPRDILG